MGWMFLVMKFTKMVQNIKTTSSFMEPWATHCTVVVVGTLISDVVGVAVL